MSIRTYYRTNIEHQSGSLATLVDYEFTNDGANRATSESRDTYVKNYDYDRTSQVVDDGLSSSYDANSNRTMAGYSVGSNNRTSTDSTWDYTDNDEDSFVKKESINTGNSWQLGNIGQHLGHDFVTGPFGKIRLESILIAYKSHQGKTEAHYTNWFWTN